MSGIPPRAAMGGAGGNDPMQQLINTAKTEEFRMIAQLITQAGPESANQLVTQLGRQNPAFAQLI